MSRCFYPYMFFLIIPPSLEEYSMVKMSVTVEKDSKQECHVAWPYPHRYNSHGMSRIS